MPLTPFVHDLNHANPVDFHAFANGGGVGIIHKASQNVIDPKYRARRPLAKAAGLKWAAYHFNTGDTAAKQAALFLNAADLQSDEAAYLDWERNPKHEMSLATALEFLDRVDQALGRRCGLYTGDVGKTRIVGATDKQREFLSLHPLWLCEYGPAAKLKQNDGHALPWAKYFLWQYTGDGVGSLPHRIPGTQQGADLSTFNGTADQLRSAWALPSLLPSLADKIAHGGFVGSDEPA